jgi:hypothetical protein
MTNTGDSPMSAKNDCSTFEVRFNREDMILEVARGAHVAATFALTEPRRADEEAHRLNYELAAGPQLRIRNGMVSRKAVGR